MFRIDNFVIDRVLYAYILDGPNGNLIGYLDQLTDASIEMSSETQDVTDARGVLIKRFYRAKTANLTATNALLNLNVMNLSLGSDKSTAEDAAFDMPASILVPAGTTTVTLAGYVADSEHCVGMTNSGSYTETYTKGTSASATEYSITDGVMTLPTATEDNFFVYYTKHVTSNGIKWTNSADEFPNSCSIVIFVTGYDVCDVTGDPQLLVIAGDSFQISPDVTINIGGGDSQTLDFSGSFQKNGCSSDQALFSIYIADDEE